MILNSTNNEQVANIIACIYTKKAKRPHSPPLAACTYALSEKSWWQALLYVVLY